MSEQKQAWVELYREAILELDMGKLPERIAAASRAIEERVHALNGSQDSRAEREALQDARRNLRLLQRSEGQAG